MLRNIRRCNEFLYDELINTIYFSSHLSAYTGRHFLSGCIILDRPSMVTSIISHREFEKLLMMGRLSCLTHLMIKYF